MVLQKTTVGLHERDSSFLNYFPAFSTTTVMFQPLLDHPLIWNVDWFKVKAGFFAIVDPTSPKDIIYLSSRDHQDMIKVALSNREPLVVLARAGDAQPPASAITATKPNLPHSPVFFRSFRVYSRFLRNTWDTMWKGKLIVPREGNFAAIFRSWSKILLLWLGTSGTRRGQSRGLSGMGEHLVKVLKKHGILGLALYLKVSLVAVNKYLAGEPLSSTWDLKFGLRLASGLPKWLPVPVRAAIRTRSLKSIRLVSSLLYTYKGLYAEPKAQHRFDAVAGVRRVGLGTSIKIENTLAEFFYFLSETYLPYLGFANSPIPQATNVPPLLTSSGPSGGTGISGFLRDAWAWRIAGTESLRYSLNIVMGLTGNRKGLELFYSDLSKYKDRQLHPQKGRKSPAAGIPCIGRLGLIPEAAGKIRVVAIIDYFSQWAFQPIHDFLLGILKTISEDGTSSQNDGLVRFRDRVKDIERDGIFFSVDISAATDTIPRELYLELLSALFKNRFFATHYMKLLSEREFLIPKDLWKNFGFKFTDYWRGQPMGAWSSFPLLGLVHHSLVQWAAFRAGSYPFADYAIVGDDLVLFDFCDGRVYSHYLGLCRFFGIPISKTKTYKSSTFFNFISRSFLNENEVTPVSIRHELSIRSMAARVEGALRVYTRWVLGDGTPSNSMVPKLARLVSDPWSWNRDIVSIQGGYLTSYLSLLLSAVFAPHGKSVDYLGVADTGWLYWAASIRGSASILSCEVSRLTKFYLGRYPSVTRSLIRTAMLALRSELESSLVSHSKIFDSYISWLKAQSAPIRVVYPLIRADTEDHACVNMSSRELLPLLGYPPEESASLMDEDLDYKGLGISFDEMLDGYIMELLIYSMGYYVPRRFLPHLRVFYSAFVKIFSDDTPVEDLGVYFRGAWDAVLAFKPMMDYSNVNILQRVSRDDFGHNIRNSETTRFIYAREGVTDRLASLVSFAWKLHLNTLQDSTSTTPPLLLPIVRD
nr:MAG: putative RNA-dependent RNA polymerase [Mitoviridae sp.]